MVGLPAAPGAVIIGFNPAAHSVSSGIVGNVGGIRGNGLDSLVDPLFAGCGDWLVGGESKLAAHSEVSSS